MTAKTKRCPLPATSAPNSHPSGPYPFLSTPRLPHSLPYQTPAPKPTHLHPILPHVHKHGPHSDGHKLERAPPARNDLTGPQQEVQEPLRRSAMSKQRFAAYASNRALTAGHRSHCEAWHSSCAKCSTLGVQAAPACPMDHP